MDAVGDATYSVPSFMRTQGRQWERYQRDTDTWEGKFTRASATARDWFDQTKDIVKGIGIIGETLAHAGIEQGIGIKNAMKDAKNCISIAQIIPQIVKMGDNIYAAYQSWGNWEVVQRVDFVAKLVFKEVMSFASLCFDALSIINRHVVVLGAGAMRIIEATGAVAGAIISIHGLVTEIRGLYPMYTAGQITLENAGEIARCLLEIGKNLCYLTLSGLLLAVVAGGVTFASPWVIFAFVMGGFVLGMFAFFAERIFAAPIVPSDNDRVNRLAGRVQIGMPGNGDVSDAGGSDHNGSGDNGEV